MIEQKEITHRYLDLTHSFGRDNGPERQPKQKLNLTQTMITRSDVKAIVIDISSVENGHAMFIQHENPNIPIYVAVPEDEMNEVKLIEMEKSLNQDYQQEERNFIREGVDFMLNMSFLDNQPRRAVVTP